MNVAARSVVIAFVGTLLWAACGSDDSGGDDLVALCKQACAKAQSLCFADSGQTFECKCNPPDAGATTCTNEDEISAAYKACLEKNSCNDLLGCKIPKCEVGGSNGTDGGTSSG